MKTGVADVGGGLRGIYAAGVLDYYLEKNIRFGLGTGVSAGSANLASYCAGQRGRGAGLKIRQRGPGADRRTGGYLRGGYPDQGSGSTAARI